MPINLGSRVRDMPDEAPRALTFLATPEKGEVSALLIRPENASHLLVLGHGASTTMRHATLQTIAERLAEVDIATLESIVRLPGLFDEQSPLSLRISW